MYPQLNLGQETTFAIQRPLFLFLLCIMWLPAISVGMYMRVAIKKVYNKSLGMSLLTRSITVINYVIFDFDLSMEKLIPTGNSYHSILQFKLV